VAVANARNADTPPQLEHEGFQLFPHRSAIADFRDPAIIEERHSGEIRELLLEVSGAGGTRRLTQGQEFYPQRFSPSGTARGEVVFRDGALVVVPGQAIRTQQVVSIPVPEGRQIPGIRQDGRGFVPVDEHGRVEGRDDVFAIGDMTAFPIKQGGIAAQQADAAAEWIAALAGAEIEPRPFRPVLRGLLLTGLRPRFLRSDPLAGTSEVDMEPLWWPPGKIAGRYLAPFLAEHLGLSSEPPSGLVDEPGAHEVDVELAWSGGARVRGLDDSR